MIKRLLTISVLAITIAIFSQPTIAATSVELVQSSRVILRINPGTTIDSLIQKVYPNEATLWPQIKQKLIRLNPYSFHQYSEDLVEGARLKLVDIKRIYQKEVSHKKKVGYVAEQTGKVLAKDINGATQELLINSQIFEGDRITTSRDSTIVIAMDDGAEVHLKQDSIIKITEYIFSSGFDNASSSIMDLLRGGFRKITGLIGDNAQANYQVQTGLATIGIRGTEYVVKLCKQDDCSQTVSRNDPEAKLHAAVLKGVITLTTADEVRILMAIGEYGTASTGELAVHENTPVPVGMLDKEEDHRFNVTIPEQKILESKESQEEGSSKSWLWLLGLLLLL
ncbi:MAG: hypothetical protein ACI9KN_000660 [Gammaproteobacteria bacterium]